MKKALGIINHGTYEIGDGFFIDIVENNGPNESYEAWMYHEQYSVKSLMFELMKSGVTIDEFIETVKKNIRQHKRIYITEYMDEKI